MRSTFKILFYINRSKVRQDGHTAILCRITVDGASTVMTTGEECTPEEWNVKAKRNIQPKIESPAANVQGEDRAGLRRDSST